MSYQTLPLIVGAGPVGLAAALFLTRQGRAVRVVEMQDLPVRESRALAVNPRTLEILEPLGITRQMLELGLPIRGVDFHREQKFFAKLSLDPIHSRYPFMLGLSQASTERLLLRALERAGGKVERGVKLVDCHTSDDGVEAILQPTAGGTLKVAECPWLLAADGARSTVRDKLRVDFPGTSLANDWYLADVPLRTALPADHAQVFFFENGRLLFMIRVVDETQREQAGSAVWRLMSNRPEPLAQLVLAEQAGAPLWESGFHISHRMVADLTVQGVYFAGDAAHLHSPLGARGMNLGLEDAWVFSELVRTKRLAEYTELRRKIDRDVVRRVELLTRMAAAESPFSRILREFAFPAVVKTPVLRGRMLAVLTGLDHKLADFNQ
jgi:2-polyprenyl-6-methoxyphenol hydroxylase-like FAD-dependent oxidoreductase